MKIQFCPYPLQLKHTFTVATCSRTHTPDVLVQIEHEGLVGYGEASMPPYLGESVESVMAFLAKVDLTSFEAPGTQTGLGSENLGGGAETIGRIMAYVDALVPGNCAAKAAIDIALHDLWGKIVGRPLWQMINPLDVTVAPDRCTVLTTYTIGIDTREMVQQKTKEVEGQFGRLKIKVGVDGDHQLVEAIREVTDVPLTVDANQGWTDRSKALDEIEWLASQGCIMVEQPLPKTQLADLAWLTAHSPLPIIADESVQRLSDVARLRDSFSGINIKLMKCTGLHEAKQMVAEARRLGMKVMLGCMTETSCAVSAAAQLSPLADFADLDGNLLISNDPFKGVGISEGYIQLNDKAGLGLTPLTL